jgi:2-keto-3-deoxy-6-phosphogluconate aldolase
MPRMRAEILRRVGTPRAAAFIATALALLVVAAAPTPLSAGERAQPDHPPRLDSRLARVLEAFDGGGTAEAVSVARAFGIDVEGDRLRLVVETSSGRSDEAAAVARGLGAEVEGRHQELVQALVPVAALEALSSSGAVEFLRPPLVAVPLVTSQGVGLTNADDWQAQGLTGAGVKVAVLDLGFQGYTSLLGTELPPAVTAQSFRADADITAGGINHGTGVAEIVYDMAPGAQMYFANFDTEVELANASQWLTAQGVHVINASWGYFTSGPGDGTGIVDDVVTQSSAAGTMWTVAAGNHANRHWSGQFRDTNNNTFHEFQDAPILDEGNQPSSFFGSLFAGETVAAELKWDDPFGAACRDYDLYLKRIDDNNQIVTVAASETRQNDGGCVPGANPVEMILTVVPVTDEYHLVIQEHAAATDANMDLYSGYHDIEYVVTANSVLQPADSADALTVGAVYWNSPNTIESFSSRGPTSDGRIKPDIAGPDGVSTATYGPSAFFGTSAASPHIAGAAALVRQQLPCYSPAQLKAFLETNVVDLGSAGKDNEFGSGRLSLAAVPLDTDGDGLANDCDPDDDNDTWNDVAEDIIDTDPLLACGTDAWPADINNDGVSDISDIVAVGSNFGKAVPPAPARHDVAPDPPDGVVDITDIARVGGFFGKSCS